MFVDSQRIKHHELRDGDVIQLGEHSLVYRDLRESTGQQVRIEAPAEHRQQTEEVADAMPADSTAQER